MIVRPVILLVAVVVGLATTAAVVTWNAGQDVPVVLDPLPFHADIPEPTPVAEPGCGGHPFSDSGVHCTAPQDYSSFPGPETLPPYRNPDGSIHPYWVDANTDGVPDGAQTGG